MEFWCLLFSGRGAQFTAKFYKSFQKSLGLKVNHSTTFHPQTDGKSRVNDSDIGEYVEGVCGQFKDNWDDHLPPIEFPYNNNYHLNIKMNLYEVVYGRRCKYPIIWFEVGEFWIDRTVLGSSSYE